MSVVSRSTLKGYFNTGDRPTESNFADLIDSTLNLNDSNTNITASNMDVEGTTNLDVVDVDGTFTIANNTSIQGENSSGFGRNIANISSGNNLIIGQSNMPTQIVATDITLDATDIDLTGNVTASSLTLNKNIVSAANTDAAFYTINGPRGEIRSQLQEALAADTGFTIELRNTSIAANSLIIANLIGGEGGLITGSVVTANVVAANTASLNFFNTGAAVVNDAKFTASFAVL